MKWNISAKVKFVFAVIIFLFFFLGSLAYFNIKRLEGANEWVDHSHRIIHSLQIIYGDLKDAQANYAVFLLTRNKNEARACEADIGQIDKELQRADDLVSQDILGRQSIGDLRILAGKQLTSMRVGMAYVRAGRPDLAIGNIQNEGEKKDNKEIKELINRMSGMQIWLLKTRKDIETSSTQKNIHFMVFGSLTALLVCGLAAFFINRQINERQAMLNQIRTSEEKYRFLAENSNEAHVTAAQDGKILDINPSAEIIFGYLKSELIGKNLTQLMPEAFVKAHGDRTFEKFLSITDPSAGINSAELNARKKDGYEFPVEVSVYHRRTKEGTFYTTITRDITERKFFMKTLLKNEHRLFQFLEAIPVGIMVRDATGMPYYANQAAKNLLGRDILKNEAAPTKASQFFPVYVAGTNQPYPEEKLPITRAFKGEKTFVDDMEIHQPDKVIPVHSWGAPIMDENGQIKYSLAALIDNTHQNEITASLQSREEFFRNLFEEGPIGMTLSFPDSTLVNVNRAFCSMLGYPKDQIVGRSFMDFTHPEDIPDEQGLSEKLFSKLIPNYQIEKRYITRKGQTIWCKLSASVIRDLSDEPLFRLAVVENITEQKEAETALKENEERFRTLMESANDAIISIDSKGNIIFFNSSAEKIFGYSQKEAQGRPFSFLMSESSWRANYQIIQNYLATGKASIPGRTIELVGKRKDGAEFPAEISYFSWKTTAGLFFTSIMRDIAERKKSEIALKQSEERFRAVTESANDAIVTADAYGNIIYFNPAATRLFEYDSEEINGYPFTSLLADRSYEDCYDDFRRAFAGGTSRLVGRTTEWIGLSKNGREFPLELSLYTWFTDQEIFVTTILRDISERKQIEEMKNDLMSVVSHQLKTPVAEINGYIENMLEGLAGELSGRQKQYLLDMKDIGMENYRLISDLLSMSKIERGVITVDPKPIPISQIIEAAFRDYESLIQKKGLSLIMGDIPKDVWVLADGNKTIETLRNIINNAIKCTDHGTISVGIKIEKDFGLIDVTDTGIGMSDETLKKLFTKARVMSSEAGRAGAGLGLYIAKNFMNLQNGDISVISKVGEGSTFRVKIPLTSKENAQHV